MGRCRSILLSNQKSSALDKQVRMPGIAGIERIYAPVIDHDLPVGNCFCLAVPGILPPGIVGFPGSRSGNALKFNPHLIKSTLTAEKDELPYYFPWRIRYRPLLGKQREHSEGGYPNQDESNADNQGNGDTSSS